MTNPARYEGLVELHDPETALRERVWAVLAATSAAAAPAWRGSVVPLNGSDFGALLPAHIGRTIRVRLVDAPGMPAAWLRLEQWHASENQRGDPIGTACALGTVLGLPATTECPADRATLDVPRPEPASSPDRGPF